METIRSLPPGADPRQCSRSALEDLPVCHSHARIWANENPLRFLALRLGRVTGVAVAWVVRETYVLEVTLAVERASGPPLEYSAEEISRRSSLNRSALCRGILVHLAMDTAQVVGDALASAGDSQSAAMVRANWAKGRRMARAQATELRATLERAGFGAAEIDAALAP